MQSSPLMYLYTLVNIDKFEIYDCYTQLRMLDNRLIIPGIVSLNYLKMYRDPDESHTGPPQV